jgi:hypothetical protein
MRKPTSYFLFLLLAFGCLSIFSTAAVADDDPPWRVARLNYVQGSVSFQPAGENEWVQANPNRPLTTGDNLWADRDSRGELHIDSTAIRLSGETGISFLNIDDHAVQIQLAQGTLNVRLRELDGGDAFEIDTPNLAFTLLRPGEYRVDVDPDGNATIITVREGEGEATGGGTNYHLNSGERTRFSGTDLLTYDRGRVGFPDGFDQWCHSRDDHEERAQSARYVSRDVIGYEDLDDYGEWTTVPEYGAVWFPSRVAVGWAPYRYGHWVWIEPWGWTWVEDEPWGFAPFHYGRWAEFRGRWCWVPGPRVVRPVYAPALVAFVGGSRFSVSLSIGGGGGVAWFPLGPREVYVPPYRTSVRYVQNVNITNTTVNVTNVTNVYNNVNVNRVSYMHQENIGAVTAVSRDTFVNARPVAGAAVRVNPQQLRTAQIQRNVTVAPDRKSIIGAGAPTPANVRPREEIMKRQVVVKLPPPPRRVSTQNGQPVSPSQPIQPSVQQPGRPSVQEPSRPAVQQPSRPAVQEPNRPAVQQPSRPAVQEPNRPAVQRPERPAVREPNRPAVQQPSRPAVREPNRPAVQEPNRPAVQRPERPAVREPSRPAVQEPNRPAVREPSRPAVQEPNRPAVQQPPPARSAPPARSETSPGRANEKGSARGQDRGQQGGQKSNRQGGGDQERK